MRSALNEFNLKRFQQSAREGRLEETVHEFLQSSGNNLALSEGLKRQKRYWIGPVEVDLSRLQRCTGPEKSMEYRLCWEDFEPRVSGMVEAIRKGWDVPPLIVESRDGWLSIRDGNHRIEALRRVGCERTWIVAWFNDLDDLVHHVRFEPQTFFITGTSGAGKTTLVAELNRRSLPFLDIHDFDEGGVPEGADQHWRMERTEEWLKAVGKNREKAITTVVCGVCVPKEIQDAPSFSKELQVHYGMLKAPEEEIRQRLTARNWPLRLIADNLEWAKHLERFVTAEEDGLIIDHYGLDPAETADAVLAWIIRETGRI